MSSIPGYSLFQKLTDVDRSWRSRFFIIEHETNFLQIPIAWTDEAHVVKRTSNLLESDLTLLIELHFWCSLVEPSALVYIEKFIYRHKHPLDAGIYDLIGHVSKLKGIF